jgi:hypothetical protein
LKKPTGSVLFRFYKPETEKTESNPNKKKPGKKPKQTGKTEPNQFEPVSFKITESKPVDLNRLRFSFDLKKNSLVTFFDENRIELKMITHTS